MKLPHHQILIVFVLMLPVFMHAQTRTLDFYLTRADSNSPLIARNRNNSRVAALQLEQIRSMLNRPRVDVESGILFAPILVHDNGSDRLEWISPGAADYTGYDLAVTDGGQYQAWLSLKQSLLTGPALRAHQEKTNLRQQINQNEISLQEHELQRLVSYQYLLCLEAKMLISNSDSLISNFGEQLSMMQVLVDHGIYKHSDMMLMQIEMKTHRMQHETYLALYRSRLYDLNLVCGIDDTTVVQLEPVRFNLQPALSKPSQFLTSYALDSLSIVADQALFALKYQPKLEVFANTGLNATYRPTFNRLGFSTGVTFSLNLYDGHQRKMQQQITGIRQQTVDFEKNSFKIQKKLRIRNIVDQLASLNKKITLATQQISDYNNLRRAYTSQLKQGLISVMDYKNLINDMIAKEQALVRLKMEKQSLINTYNYWNY